MDLERNRNVMISVFGKWRTNSPSRQRTISRAGFMNIKNEMKPKVLLGIKTLHEGSYEFSLQESNKFYTSVFIYDTIQEIIDELDEGADVYEIEESDFKGCFYVGGVDLEEIKQKCPELFL